MCYETYSQDAEHVLIPHYHGIMWFSTENAPENAMEKTMWNFLNRHYMWRERSIIVIMRMI